MTERELQVPEVMTDAQIIASLRITVIEYDALLEAHRRFHRKVGCPVDTCYVCSEEEAVAAAQSESGN